MLLHSSRPPSFSSLALVLLIAAGCGSDSPSDPDRPDAGGDSDAASGGDDGVLPPLVPQSGVAYVGHFHSGALLSVRTDMAEPALGPEIDLGMPTHDVLLDEENDRLVVISDVARSAKLFSIERPASAGADIAAPSELATISFETIPRFGAINPYRNRLYVVTADPNQSPLTTMELHAYDTTDPTAPTVVSGWPKTIPVTVSFALDAVRDVFFVIELTTDTLYAYDVGSDQFDALAGSIVLTEQFPQTNQASFQPRALTADVRRNRLLAARSQSALSELIVIEYPAAIPTGGARYRDFAGLGDLTFVDDGFDVDKPLDERSNLLDAYVVGIDVATGLTFMSSDAWNGTASMAVLTAFAPDASLAAGCNDVPDEGFGCFLRSHAGGTPSSFVRTDGAMCVDGQNRRVVTTSVDIGDESQPGLIHVFDYSADLATMGPALPAGGGNLVADALPIGAVCH